MRCDLFVIDGQNDFCASGDEPEKKQGALFVVNANEEAVRVADMIKRLKATGVQGGHKINRINASLDSHHRNDGSHNTSYRTQSGAIPDPFTVVSVDDAKNQIYRPIFSGRWKGKSISGAEWLMEYTAALANPPGGGPPRAPLILWTPHCEIGTWGQNVYGPLMDAYNDWCGTTGGWINWISKGTYPLSEHYSALKAEVTDPERPETAMNSGVVQDASNADIIVWTGWAGSHCLRWTGLDGVNWFDPTPEEAQKGMENEFIKKCVFMEDASSPVVNPFDDAQTELFAKWRREFLDEMESRGARISTTTDFLK